MKSCSKQFVRIFHSCAINEQKYCFCWGKNNEGQLGIGSTTDENVPKFVRSLTLPTTLTTTFTSTISSTFTSTISTTENESFPVIAEDKSKTIIIIVSSTGAAIFAISVFIIWKYCKRPRKDETVPFNMITGIRH